MHCLQRASLAQPTYNVPDPQRNDDPLTKFVANFLTAHARSRTCVLTHTRTRAPQRSPQPTPPRIACGWRGQGNFFSPMLAPADPSWSACSGRLGAVLGRFGRSHADPSQPKLARSARVGAVGCVGASRRPHAVPSRPFLAWRGAVPAELGHVGACVRIMFVIGSWFWYMEKTTQFV